MKRELLLQKIEGLLEKMPWYVKEYYRAKLAVPYSFTTLFEYLKEYDRFFSFLIKEKLAPSASYSEITLETLEKLKKREVEAYILHLRTRSTQNTSKNHRGLSQTTINRTISALSSLYKFLTEEVEDDHGEPFFYRNVMKKIATSKKKETLAARAENIKPKLFLGNQTNEYLTFISEHYLHTLNEKTRATTLFLKNKERDLAINALFLGTGIRLSEAINVDIHDLNLQTNRVEVFRKGGKRDSVNIAHFAIPYLEDYLRVRKVKYAPEKEQRALFLTNFKGRANRIDASSVEKMVAKYSQAFKVKVSPHKLRHTLATRLYEQTNSQVLVSHQLGHASTQVTDLYTHIVDEEQKNALDKL